MLLPLSLDRLRRQRSEGIGSLLAATVGRRLAGVLCMSAPHVLHGTNQRDEPAEPLVQPGTAMMPYRVESLAYAAAALSRSPP